MKTGIYNFLIKFCILCGKYKPIILGKLIQTKTNYKAFICNKCRNKYREE